MKTFSAYLKKICPSCKRYSTFTKPSDNSRTPIALGKPVRVLHGIFKPYLKTILQTRPSTVSVTQVSGLALKTS